ncbi:glycosyltransferase family 2 protein [Sporosarcina sp. P1]|uniref:glycosyltransferase n=1 Tax=Sporosarcina sp. P1 TaxID=2048257 RepID=UPI000C16B414|nr:glycosyltransferase [Sporosarcina sp. P1]PIC84000.1 4,5-dihydroxyphthalate decarboxylase [Sporosarcina sp. P1]
MDIFVLLLSIALVVALLGLLCGVLVFWRVPIIRDKGNSTSSVSIIIPARNEELRLKPLLESIVRQQYVTYEVIVVDDGSTDRTRELARSYGATVISNELLEDGWIGKSAACWAGALAAENKLLLFMDADTVFTHPDSLSNYIASFESMGSRGILSLQPDHYAEKWYEQLAFLFPLIVMVGMNVFTIAGNRLKAGGSFGPCLLCEKAQYQQVGGHAVVRGAVMDDLALGKAFQEHDLPVRCFGGKGIAWLRMYPGGLSDMVQGYSKSMASGSTATLPLVMGLIYIWMAGASITPMMLVASGFSSTGWLGVSIGLYTLYAMELVIASRRVGRFVWWIFPLYPLLLIVFILIFMYSLYLSKRKGSVQWKGRNINV